MTTRSRKHMVTATVLNELEAEINQHTNGEQPNGWDWDKPELRTDHDWLASQATFLLRQYRRAAL